MARQSSGLTDIGRKRVGNEDAFGLDENLGIYVVADGMGGHAAGEVASQEAVDTVLGMVRRQEALIKAYNDGDKSPESLRKLQRLLESSLQAATYMVFSIAENDPEQKGMGTTCSALLLLDGIGITGQVGDSRVYMVRDGTTTRLTEDHTLVAWQVKQGIISEQEAERSPHRNVITRAVGSRDYVQVDTRVFDYQLGDVFITCSDGLHGYIQDNEFAGFVGGQSPEQAATQMIAVANQRGGRDNITVVVVRIV